MKDMEAAN